MKSNKIMLCFTSLFLLVGFSQGGKAMVHGYGIFLDKNNKIITLKGKNNPIKTIVDGCQVVELESFRTERTGFDWYQYSDSRYTVFLDDVNIHKSISVDCLNWFICAGFKVIINPSSFISLRALEEFILSTPKRKPNQFADLISTSAFHYPGFTDMGRADRVKERLIELGFNDNLASDNFKKASSQLEVKGFKIVEGLVDSEDFFSNKGWGSEPLTSTLEVPGEIVGAIFPASDKELSLTGYLKGKPIAQRNNNRWEYFLTQLPENLQRFEIYSSENVALFVKILGKVLEKEFELRTHLESEGIVIQDVLHNSGLMVLKEFRKQGYALQLQEQAIHLATVKGFKAIVVETTNIGSARVMAKLGFQKFFEFSYMNFGINLDDVYTIWYIKL